tara:strand:+ start:12739 stop:14706 length:1968 start_codon:yes stop_codon:yes gene_type:complete
MLKTLRYFFLLFLSFEFSAYQTVNSHGQVGYINTPSAMNLNAPAYLFGASRDIPDRKIYFTASPYDWLDATIFYVDITNKEYIFWNGGSDPTKTYKDKGFNIKASFDLSNTTYLGIGANDIAGTGYYNSEYIVLTKFFNRHEMSIGMGWGNYADGISLKNPFLSLSDSFRVRKEFAADQGGTINFDNFFSGEDSSLFIAGSYQVDENTKFIYELDPTSTEYKIDYPSPKSRLNLAIERKFRDFSLKAGFIRGSEVFLHFNYVNDLRNFNNNKFIGGNEKIDSIYKLSNALSRNGIGLNNVSQNDELAEVSVTQTKFSNQYEPNEIINSITNELFSNQDLIVTHKYLGMEVLSTFHKGERHNVRNESYVREVSKKEITFASNRKFPIFINTISPRIRNFIASREAFYHGAFLIENDLEVLFRDNIVLISNFKYSLFDNFDELDIPPLNTYPNQVRSDIKKYLNNFDRGLIIGRLELARFDSLDKSHFFKSTIGIFEEMFGGVGIEYLYHPPGSLISFGAESYFVKKRDYKMKLGFKDYENYMFRINAQLLEPQTNTYLRVSFGEYLAGDKGYTLELSKRFDNGIEFSAFFTRTDVSKELFGEGSFDKGINLKIPFNIFDNNRNLGNISWRPLTKDPGSLLIKSVNLQEQINRYRVY